MEIISRSSARSEEKEIIRARLTKIELISFTQLNLMWCPDDDKQELNAHLAKIKSLDKESFLINVEIIWTYPKRYKDILNFFGLT